MSIFDITKVIVDPRTPISREMMYRTLLHYHDMCLRGESVDTEEKSCWCRVDESVEISFSSPDQVVLLENMDTEKGVVTGIDFETAFELLDPYVRRMKIEKIIKKI
jgi:hypothetical protein